MLKKPQLMTHSTIFNTPMDTYQLNIFVLKNKMQYTQQNKASTLVTLFVCEEGLFYYDQINIALQHAIIFVRPCYVQT